MRCVWLGARQTLVAASPSPPPPFPHPPPPLSADVFIQPLVFLAIYYSLTLPAIPFLELYGVGVLVVWYCSSLGTLLSLLAPPSSSLLATVALIMVRLALCLEWLLWLYGCAAAVA